MTEDVKNIVVDELTALKERIARNIVATGQNASGRTIASLEIVDTDTSVSLLGRRYFKVLETGRRGGRVPYKFSTIIRQWMEDKGIKATPIPYIRIPSEKWQPKYTPQERGDMSLAGAIAHKIKTEGTKLFKDGGREDVYSSEIPQTVASIREKLRYVFMIKTINGLR